MPKKNKYPKTVTPPPPVPAGDAFNFGAQTEQLNRNYLLTLGQLGVQKAQVKAQFGVQKAQARQTFAQDLGAEEGGMVGRGLFGGSQDVQKRVGLRSDLTTALTEAKGTRRAALLDILNSKLQAGGQYSLGLLEIAQQRAATQADVANQAFLNNLLGTFGASIGGPGGDGGGQGTAKNVRVPGTSEAAAMAQWAVRAVKGSEYVTGQEGEFVGGVRQWDCSGLVYESLRHAGLPVPRLTARGYQAMFPTISKRDLRPGDLVYYWYPNDRGIASGQATHIEIYVGHGMTVGADHEGETPRVESIDWSAFLGGGRVMRLQDRVGPPNPLTPTRRKRGQA